MFEFLLGLGVGTLFVGPLIPITVNRVRRGMLNGWNKVFGKLPPGAPDPTSKNGSAP